MIFHSKPTLDDSDRQALLDVLASGRLVQPEAADLLLDRDG